MLGDLADDVVVGSTAAVLNGRGSVSGRTTKQ
jgi:hypothetical protein